MRALVVYCHPRRGSFTEAVRDVVMRKLEAAGAEVRLRDLYAEGFDPVMSARDHEFYEDEAQNRMPVASHCADIAWCDTLIFVYPTWWYGLPAMIKGWLDRVLVPGLAFLMPDAQHPDIRPGLTHVTRLGVFTTCGASFWLTRVIGAPGKRTLLRGVRLLCAKRCRTVFAAHYLMDSSTDESRARHLARVAAKMDKLTGPLPRSLAKEATA
ncbi:NAD(P)H-dependent oxidoreductase [Roseibacterium sp. SDUM158016]|uniref:NAD(P)H-dependent oxidoreductase n=1 Tax=Roseicyclus sediminis TaxID=2980997 RepID=UPI0021D2233F|nr:NAD(P)H-dependent oxidoreductase [Roseibacterium sp. SDUM158016]MCU4653089.1 NAD(P)H-dependent oxidoreductase [Roseibacterium sp. SDUM158016]